MSEAFITGMYHPSISLSCRFQISDMFTFLVLDRKGFFITRTLLGMFAAAGMPGIRYILQFIFTVIYLHREELTNSREHTCIAIS
jgi:hypothetical protein